MFRWERSASRRLIQQVLSQCAGNCFGFGVYLKLAVDVLNVECDGVDTHAKLYARGLVAMAFHQQLEKPQFVGRQIVVCLRWRVEFPKKLYNPPGYLRRHGR